MSVAKDYVKTGSAKAFENIGATAEQENPSPHTKIAFANRDVEGIAKDENEHGTVLALAQVCNEVGELQFGRYTINPFELFVPKNRDILWSLKDNIIADVSEVSSGVYTPYETHSFTLTISYSGASDIGDKTILMVKINNPSKEEREKIVQEKGCCFSTCNQIEISRIVDSKVADHLKKEIAKALQKADGLIGNRLKQAITPASADEQKLKAEQLALPQQKPTMQYALNQYLKQSAMGDAEMQAAPIVQTMRR